MKLSLQTVCIIFGVTLVHLVLIATLSPVGGEGENYLGPVSETLAEGAVADEAPASLESIPASPGGNPTPVSLPDAAPAEPIDLPARRRENAAAPSTNATEPVAATRPIPQSPRS
jgi:hypothetical protein